MVDIDNSISRKQNIRRQRFIRIAESRVNRILGNLDNLGKCANRRNYEYSEQEARKIFREIERKVKETKALFEGQARSRGKFRLEIITNKIDTKDSIER